MRKIKVQGGHRYEALIDRMEVRLGIGFEILGAHADPIIRAPSRIFLSNDVRLVDDSFAKPGHLDSFHGAQGTVWDIDREQDRGIVRVFELAFDQFSGVMAGRFKLKRKGVRLRGFQGEGHRQGPQDGTFKGCGYRSGIGDVVGKVASVVDSGNDQVGFSRKNHIQSEIDAIGRSSVDRKVPGIPFVDPKGFVKRQGVRGGGSFFVWSDDVNVSQIADGFLEGFYPLRVDAIVIGQEDKGTGQCFFGRQPRSTVEDLVLGVKVQSYAIRGRGERI